MKKQPKQLKKRPKLSEDEAWAAIRRWVRRRPATANRIGRSAEVSVSTFIHLFMEESGRHSYQVGGRTIGSCVLKAAAYFPDLVVRRKKKKPEPAPEPAAAENTEGGKE